MGFISTGPGGAQNSGGLVQNFSIQPGISQIPISFRWAFLSEEFLEFCNSQFDDIVRVSLTNGGQTQNLLETSVNSLCAEANLIALPDLDFDRGDVHWTGWRDTILPAVAVQPGPAELRIQMEDIGDQIFDSVFLIDAIRFNVDPLPAP
jgi:hypothetical protein